MRARNGPALLLLLLLLPFVLQQQPVRGVRGAFEVAGGPPEQQPSVGSYSLGALLKGGGPPGLERDSVVVGKKSRRRQAEGVSQQQLQQLALLQQLQQQLQQLQQQQLLQLGGAEGVSAGELPPAAAAALELLQREGAAAAAAAGGAPAGAPGTATGASLRAGPPGGAPAAGGGAPQVGLLRRLAYRVRNTGLVDELLAVLRYFVGSSPGRPTKALLQQSDAVGLGLGMLLYVLRMQQPGSRSKLARSVLQCPEVARFVARFGYLAEPERSSDELLQQLLRARSTAARLALGAYGARQQAEFLQLVAEFKKEYFHLLGFAALCLSHLPQSLPALALFVDRLLLPLQDALRSIASVSARFKGFSVALAQQQLLGWVQQLSALDAALLQQLPGGSHALNTLKAASNYEATLEETESSYGSQEGEEAAAALNSQL